MSNRRYNTQTRKKFSEGTKKRLETKANLEKRMERRKQFNKKNEKTFKNKVKQPMGKIPLMKEAPRKPSPRQQKEMRRIKELERKPSPRQQKEMRRIKELERRQFGKTSEDKKPRINKLKDKINKIGNMKVKDAAKAVGQATLATTPIGLATNAAKKVNKNFKLQSPIVRKNRKFGGR
jgi:hypothetical protein